MEEKFVKSPLIEITVAGKNITADVSKYLSSVDYTDKLEEESDEAQLVFDDVAGLWQTDWYPQQGDTLTLRIGYKDNFLDCGTFEIDEIELSGGRDTGDVLTVKALAAAINKGMRTKNSKAYEKQTLKKIAQQIADKHGLKIVGTVPNIEIGRLTQNNESDLSFLAGLAKKYGVIFSVRGGQLVFISPGELESQSPIATFDKSQVGNYQFKDRTADTFTSASVSKRDIKTSKVQKWNVKADGDPTKLDDLVVGGRVENEGQAEALADGALRDKNKEKLTGSFSTEGNPLLCAGVNVEMKNFGAFSGNWLVKESKHTVTTDGGYQTSVELTKELKQKTVEPKAKKSAAETKNYAKLLGLN